MAFIKIDVDNIHACRVVRRLLVCVAAAIAVVVAAAFAAPLLIPSDFIKAQIASVVGQKTGRDLHIAGPISFSLLPRFAIVAQDVTLSNPSGGFSAALLNAGTVEVVLEPLALLQGAIKIDQLKLARPTISFEIDKDGRRNWIFGHAATPVTASPGERRDSLSLALDNATIVDGEVSYLDQRTGKKRNATSVNMTLSLPSFAGALKAAGSASCNAETVKFSMVLASPGALRDGEASAATIALGSARGDLEFQGQVGGPGPIKATGTVNLKLPSLREFLAWAGLPVAAHGRGFGPLTINGKIEVAGPRFALSDAKIMLDAISARGALSVDRSGERPTLSGHLDIDRLDLDPYIPANREVPSAGAAVPDLASPGAGSIPATIPNQPLRASPSWSKAFIDLAPLKLANVDLRLNPNAIRLGGIDIDKSTLTLNLKDGRLQLDVNEMALYHGKGSGEIVGDGGGAGLPAFGAALKFTGITVRQVPLDIAGLDQLSGTGDIHLLLSAHGSTVREIVGSLDGGGSIEFVNGTIGSVGLGPLMKNSMGPAVGNDAIPREIDYRLLSGTAMIERGILRNKDLKLDGAKMSATATGVFDLNQGRIDYLWMPKIPGLGSARIEITGAWDEPNYKVQSVTTTRGMRQPTHKPRGPAPP